MVYLKHWIQCSEPAWLDQMTIPKPTTENLKAPKALNLSGKTCARDAKISGLLTHISVIFVVLGFLATSVDNLLLRLPS